MELEFLNWINQNLHGSNFINYLVKFITILGDAGICWIVLGVILLFFKKTRKGGVFLLVSLLLTLLINNLTLKPLFNRERPFVKNPKILNFLKSINLKAPSGASFPSGHTFAAFCSATVLTLCFKKVGALSFIPATLISLSRIFLCVHYPTDVLAGIILGSALGFGSYFLTKWLYPKIENKILNIKNNRKKQKNTHENLNNI